MKEGYYLIGEVSRITGISKDTLHFYSKTKLLVPDYVEESNQYRYYSRFNLWQLDIITTCRKLSVPLEQVKQILDLHDNDKITQLLLEYRCDAVRLARYYEQVANDILWYDKENQRVRANAAHSDVQLRWLEEEIVIAGAQKREISSYHANLQEAAKEELQHAETIQRKYGYILDPDQLRHNNVCKRREYLKIVGCGYEHVSPQNLHTIPCGEYAVCIVHITDGTADFSPLLSWIEENGYAAGGVYAEELGLQLFDYIGDYYCEIKVQLKKI